jgi:hypothetical protein
MPPIISVHLSDLNSKLIKSALYVKVHVHKSDRILFILNFIIFVISILSFLLNLISNIYSSSFNVTLLYNTLSTNASIAYVVEILFFVFVTFVIFTEFFPSIAIIP